MIDELPDGPDPAIDPPQVFSQKAAAMVLAQKKMVPQMNALGTQVVELAANATTKANSAAVSASAAAGAFEAALSLSGSGPFVSGKAYQKNDSAISQINFQTYRRMAAGSGSVDPSNDIANWRIVATNGAFEPQAVGGVDVDLARGRYFTKAIAGNTTFTFSNAPAGGYCFTLELAVTSGIASFPTSVRTADGRPVVLTTGRTHLLMFITSNGGATWRLAVAGNYVS